MTRKQKVTSEFLVQLDQELLQTKTIQINTIKGKADVEINLYFDEQKINKITNDLMELVTPLLSSEEITVDDLVSPITLLPALILREFSDLPLPSENNLALIAAVNESLDKQGIARQVFEKFNQNEVKKLNKLITQGFKNKPKFQQMYQELYAKFTLQQQDMEEVEVNDQVQQPE